MTIHASDPFATPEDQRSQVRRLRGRLPAPVTLWTAGDGAERVGLTVSSVLVADGDPGRVLGIVDEESDLWPVLERTGRFAVVLLDAEERRIADRFAGLLPAPGGPFAVGGWRTTEFGPVPEGERTWAGCRLDGSRPYGWGRLVEATVETVAIGATSTALVHLGGGYRDLTPDG